MTTGLTSRDCQYFIKATHPAKKWNVQQERAAVHEVLRIFVGQDTPVDVVDHVDAVF